MNRNIITENNHNTAESLDLLTHEHNIWIKAILGTKDTKEMIIKSIIYPFYFNGENLDWINYMHKVSNALFLLNKSVWLYVAS